MEAGDSCGKGVGQVGQGLGGFLWEGVGQVGNMEGGTGITRHYGHDPSMAAPKELQ
jgi:hypothetical protein